MPLLTVTALAISIHAPTRGATVLQSIRSSCGHDFNPRSHEGSDLHGKPCTVSMKISIHAPTRGATMSCSSSSLIPKISIHAPTRGATGAFRKASQASLFQSTLPRGERQQFSPKSSLFSQQKLSKIFNLNNKLF